MTSSITVKANHGWDIKVTSSDPKTGEPLLYGGIVAKNTQQDFTFHSDCDLHVHEIQPGEADPLSQ